MVTERDWRWSDAPRPDPDPAAALAQALAERDDARRERDRLARRLQAVGAISRGARFRLETDPEHEPRDLPPKAPPDPPAPRGTGGAG